MMYPQKIAFSACGRSREGAWIEITVATAPVKSLAMVAPVRERGLKLMLTPRLLPPFDTSLP